MSSEKTKYPKPCQYSQEEALLFALQKLNEGCCPRHISDGFQEWLGIIISPEELVTKLADHPGLLSEHERIKNAWRGIFSIIEDKSKPDLSAAQIQEKYGFDPKYQENTINRYKKIPMQEKENKESADTQEKLKEILLKNLAEGKTPAGDIVLALIIHVGMTEDDAWKLVRTVTSRQKNL